MSNIYVVGIDGSEGSIRAAQYAAKQALSSNASLKLIHVLEWSPYSFLTVEELGERKKRRGEELDRAKTAIIDPVTEKVSNDKLDVDSEVRFGHIAEVIHQYSEEVGASHAYVGRHGDGDNLTSRLFGSVPGILVQISSVPVTVVP